MTSLVAGDCCKIFATEMQGMSIHNMEFAFASKSPGNIPANIHIDWRFRSMFWDQLQRTFEIFSKHNTFN